jgi:prepilin-type N-terminal cleavage/methylation domain-containing protein
LFHKLLKTESGYSLVEVMVSIIILAIGILPMVGMFDMGLHSATTGSNYDKARALANLKMEEAKSLSFDSVKNSCPVTGSAPDTNGYDLYTCNDLSDCEPAVADSFPEDFVYTVKKQVMKLPTSSATDFKPCNSGLSNTCDATPTGPIRVTVTVQWDGGDNEYRTFGLVT